MIKQFEVPHPFGGVEKISISVGNGLAELTSSVGNNSSKIGSVEYAVLRDKIRIEIADVSPAYRSRNLLNTAISEILHQESAPNIKKVVFCAVDNPFLSEMFKKITSITQNKSYEFDFDETVQHFNSNVLDAGTQLDNLVKKTNFTQDAKSILLNPKFALDVFDEKFGKHPNSDSYEFTLKCLIRKLAQMKNTF